MRPYLFILALLAAALPVLSHVYVTQSLDLRGLAGEDAGVTLFNMGWSAFPVFLAMLLAHRRHAPLAGLIAFGVELALWSALSVRAGAGSPAELSGGAASGLGLVLLLMPVLLSTLVFTVAKPRPREKLF